MVQQVISVGAAPNDGSGDPLRIAFTKINENFTEIYGRDAVGSNFDLTLNTISAINTNGNISLAPNGTGHVILSGLLWPTADGTEGYVLSTDGSGNLSWQSPSTPAASGSNTWVQFNDSGVIGASAGLTFNKATNTVLTGNIGTVNTTAYLFNQTATTLNFAGAGTNVNIGASTGNTNIKNNLVVTGNTTVTNATVSGNLLVSGGNIFVSGTTLNLGTANVLSLNMGSASSNINIPGNLLVSGAFSIHSLSVDTITSNVATGTPPLIVNSSTQVSNLNAAYAGNLVNGTSNVNVLNSGNVTVSVGSVSNVLTITSTGANVAGTANITGIANVGSDVNVGGNIDVAGNTVLQGTMSTTGNANVGNLGTVGLIVATGNITGGNLTTGGELRVTGNANVSSNISVTGNAGISGNISGGNISTSGLVFATGNVTGGNLITGGNLSVTGNANITGVANITGNANIGANISVTGIANIGGNAKVGGNANITGNANVGANLYVTGIANVGSNLSVTGIANIGANLNVTGNANISSNLSVTGKANISGNANIGNNIGVVGTIYGVDANLTGNAQVNSLTVNTAGFVGGNLTIQMGSVFESLTAYGKSHSLAQSVGVGSGQSSYAFNLTPLMSNASSNSYNFIRVAVSGIYNDAAGSPTISTLHKTMQAGSRFTGGTWVLDGAAVTGTPYNSDGTNFSAGSTAYAGKVQFLANSSGVYVTVTNRTSPTASSSTSFGLEADVMYHDYNSQAGGGGGGGGGGG
jgi:hypothetical protein